MPQDGARYTPLHRVHEELGAVFTDFAGWQMPVRYGSDLAEHRAVRERAGMFDLSHMGEIEVSGPEAGIALDHALAGKLSRMRTGRAKYTLVLAPDGGVIDDVIVYRLGPERYLIVANAANTPQVARELHTRIEGYDAAVRDLSDDLALIAVQGPLSAGIVTRALTTPQDDGPGASGISAQDIEALTYYHAVSGSFDGEPLLLARTGYTGEDGFELYTPSGSAAALWHLLARVGGEDLVPCGLASRDTLRLEAGMALYGHELGTDILPAQAGLGGVVALRTKGDFVGREAIENADPTGRPVLVGLAGQGRRAARAGSRVRTPDGTDVGQISSGVLSPTLGHPIAMAFVDPDLAEPGTALVADVRGKDLPVEVTTLPFYRRP